MKLVVDANVLFALAKPSSTANHLLTRYSLKLLAPDFALIELYKYKNDLVSKSNNGTFEEIVASLKQKVTFVDREKYTPLMSRAESMMPDPKDVTYCALALSLFLPIWSNDHHLKTQKHISVFTTKELVDYPEILLRL